ncbi:hypothetical protein [Cerasicoccus frondis]|uniref:hypothetical protein n=1 Tax=Cerasicoccus frondis TaxID=490090 RepID=UPI002852B8D8|nr:hypothetical protein [Cerasicoccus frondis]
MIKNLVVGAWALMVLFFAGCESSAPATSSSPAQPFGDEFNGQVAVLPADVLSYLPEQYAFLHPMVNEATEQALIAQGYQVMTAHQVEQALDANGGALRRRIQSSSPKEMAQGVNDLIWQLRDEQAVDVLAAPQVLEQSLVIKRPYDGASWGGVRREFHVNGARNLGDSLQVDTASVVMGVYNKFGQAIYFGQGGIDFLENGTVAGQKIYLSPKLSGQIPIASVQEAVDKALARWQMELAVVMGQNGFERSR